MRIEITLNADGATVTIDGITEFDTTQHNTSTTQHNSDEARTLEPTTRGPQVSHCRRCRAHRRKALVHLLGRCHDCQHLSDEQVDAMLETMTSGGCRVCKPNIISGIPEPLTLRHVGDLTFTEVVE